MASTRVNRQFDLSGGVQTATSRLLSKPNELRDIRNATFSSLIGAVSRRLGYTQLGGTVQAAKDGLGAFVHRYSTGTRAYAATNNAGDTATVLKYLNAGTWTDLGPTIAASTRISSTNFLDEAYVVGASSSTFMSPINVDSTPAYSTTRNVHNMPKAKWVAEFQGSLYAINVDVGGTKFPDRAYKSSAAVGVITFVKTDQSGALTSMKVDSVRYLKAGMSIDVYRAGTSTKLYDLTISSVDKATNTISFTPYSLTFATTAVDTTFDSITLSDGTNFPNGTPFVLSSTTTVPAGLTAGTTYYSINPAVISTSSLRGAGTGADDSAIGSVAWVNPSNVTASDNTYATFTSGGPFFSHYLKATNFGFAIPLTATILGIKLEIEAFSPGANSADSVVKLVKGGVVSGSNYGTGSSISAVESYHSYGTGTTDLWGLTWTAADINASNFGAVIQMFAGSASVDHMRITVYYTASDPNGIQVASSLADALSSTEIDITSQGTGTHTITLSYAVSDNDEIWGDGRKDKLSVYWNSDYPTPESSDYLRIPPGQDEDSTITGWAKSNNRFFLFTSNSITKWDGQNLVPVSTTIGCLQHECIRNIGSWLIWPHTTGIWAYNDSTGQLKLISRGIQDWFKAIPLANWASASAIAIDNIYKISVGGSLTLNNIAIQGYIRFVYDFDMNIWSIESHTRNQRYQFVWTVSNVRNPYFQDDTGLVLKDEDGYLDITATIPWFIETGRDNFNFDELKAYQAVFFYSTAPQGCVVNYQIEGGEWMPLGELKHSVEKLEFPLNTQGHDINYRVSLNSKGESPIIEGISTHYSVQEGYYAK